MSTVLIAGGNPKRRRRTKKRRKSTASHSSTARRSGGRRRRSVARRRSRRRARSNPKFSLGGAIASAKRNLVPSTIASVVIGGTAFLGQALVGMAATKFANGDAAKASTINWAGTAALFAGSLLLLPFAPMVAAGLGAGAGFSSVRKIAGMAGGFGAQLRDAEQNKIALDYDGGSATLKGLGNAFAGQRPGVYQDPETGKYFRWDGREALEVDGSSVQRQLAGGLAESVGDNRLAGLAEHVGGEVSLAGMVG